MDRLVRAAMVVVGAMLVLLAAGCGGDKESDDPVIRLLQRANKADDDLGARMTLRGTVSGGGLAIHVRGYGQVEADLKRDRFVVVAGGEREETFDDEPSTFIPVTDAMIARSGDAFPLGTKWLKVDQDVVATAAGSEGLRELENLTPNETLELLPRMDPTVRAAGSERVRGVLTKRFRIAISFSKLVEVLSERAGAALGCAVSKLDGTLRMVLWIDGENLIRRMRLRVRAGGQSVVMTVTVTAYDRDLRVDVPEGAGVYDATDEIAAAARRDRTDGDDDCDPENAQKV